MNTGGTVNDWALITGASAGIGLELARLFAADKFNLVLIARNETRLTQLADELKAAHGIEIRILPRDLSEPTAAENIFDELRDIPISVLVNNAGFGSYGPLAESDLRTQTNMMQVNIIALVQLTRLFLPQMLARRSGRILNAASVAAFQPGPLVNTYYASKAFVYSFSYALTVELEGSGVTVTTLCPGSTHTEFHSRAGIKMKKPWAIMDAREVAGIGYRGLMRGKRVVIPGLMNKLASFISKRMPARITAPIVRKIHQG